MNATPKGVRTPPGSQLVRRFDLGRPFIPEEIATLVPSDEIKDALILHCRGVWGDEVPELIRSRNEAVLAGTKQAGLISYHTSSEGVQFAVLTTRDRIDTRVMTRAQVMMS